MEIKQSEKTMVRDVWCIFSTSNYRRVASLAAATLCMLYNHGPIQPLRERNLTIASEAT